MTVIQGLDALAGNAQAVVPTPNTESCRSGMSDFKLDPKSRGESGKCSSETKSGRGR